MPSGVGVLFVGSRADEHSSLQRIFRETPCELQGAFTGRDGLGLLRHPHHGICVVICDHCLPDGDWKSVLEELNDMPDRPALIVSSRLADERLWAEVLNLGAFDLLLGSPFVPEEVLRVTQSASLAWNMTGDRGKMRRLIPGFFPSPWGAPTMAVTAGSGR